MESKRNKNADIDDEQRIYHVKVMQSFLTAGVPLNKLLLFRKLLEENGCHLTDHHYLSDLIPFILAQDLKATISVPPISDIFDGTCRAGEVFVIVVHYYDHET